MKANPFPLHRRVVENRLRFEKTTAIAHGEAFTRQLQLPRQARAQTSVCARGGNPSTSAVYEELIHTAQLRRGMTDVTQMEIEAAQKLIRFAERYKIPAAETQQTMDRLQALLLKQGAGQ